MKVAVKEVGKDVEYIEVDDKYRLECCKKFTGKENSVDFVSLNREGTFCIAVNEDGLSKKLPTNFLIEILSPDFPIQKMVGTVVFIRSKYADPYLHPIYDYEVDDLREEDIELITMILEESYQAELKNTFVDYGKGHMVIRPL